MRSIAARKAEGPRVKIKRSEPAITGAGRCFRIETIICCFEYSCSGILLMSQIINFEL